MSTDLGDVANLNVRQLSMGRSLGIGLQLTPTGTAEYAQLTRSEVGTLYLLLGNWLARTEADLSTARLGGARGRPLGRATRGTARETPAERACRLADDETEA